uniref:Uncharacterized protein n=1 Tax=Anguilla anguilla TaxID=7936 RepID=A0A0E9R8K7_ANGAN
MKNVKAWQQARIYAIELATVRPKFIDSTAIPQRTFSPFQRAPSALLSHPLKKKGQRN